MIIFILYICFITLNKQIHRIKPFGAPKGKYQQTSPHIAQSLHKAGIMWVIP